MSPDVVKAQREVQRLRAVIAKFQRLRTANNEVLSGMRSGLVPPDQATAIASAYRDPAMEAQAVEHLRSLITMLRGGEAPPSVDMENPLPVGIEESLGFPVAAAVAAVAASVAIAAYSAFSYLTTREERVLEETRGPVASFMHSLGENTWALAALGGVLFAGLVYVDMRYRKPGAPSKPGASSKPGIGAKLGGLFGKKERLGALVPKAEQNCDECDEEEDYEDDEDDEGEEE